MKARRHAIVVEGLALYSFRDMRNSPRSRSSRNCSRTCTRRGAPSRLRRAVHPARTPLLSERERDRARDFALECAQTLIDQNRAQTSFTDVMQVWMDAGIDVVAAADGGSQEEMDELVAGSTRAGGSDRSRVS